MLRGLLIEDKPTDAGDFFKYLWLNPALADWRVARSDKDAEVQNGTRSHPMCIILRRPHHPFARVWLRHVPGQTGEREGVSNAGEESVYCV